MAAIGRIGLSHSKEEVWDLIDAGHDRQRLLRHGSQARVGAVRGNDGPKCPIARRQVILRAEDPRVALEVLMKLRSLSNALGEGCVDERPQHLKKIEATLHLRSEVEQRLHCRPFKKLAKPRHPFVGQRANPPIGRATSRR